VSRVACLWFVSTPNPQVRQALEIAAQELRLQLRFLAVHGPEDPDSAFEAATREQADGLFVLPSPLANMHSSIIVDRAAQHRLPAMYSQREFVDDGGLMVYAPRVTESYRRSAAYVDKLLKGAKPADLPVEQPMTFEFVVNMKTAQALGITFPNEIMLQVTEVVDQ